ncbi:MAG: hypothetical protein HC896_06965 [Bacteroidales bacterium]|nr:hypothetical protein [Bacteroidales bacterium]
MLLCACYFSFAQNEFLFADWESKIPYATGALSRSLMANPFPDASNNSSKVMSVGKTAAWQQIAITMPLNVTVKDVLKVEFLIYGDIESMAIQFHGVNGANVTAINIYDEGASSAGWAKYSYNINNSSTNNIDQVIIYPNAYEGAAKTFYLDSVKLILKENSSVNTVIANWEGIKITKTSETPGSWHMYGWQGGVSPNNIIANPHKNNVNPSDSVNVLYFPATNYGLYGVTYIDGIKITNGMIGVQLLLYSDSIDFIYAKAVNKSGSTIKEILWPWKAETSRNGWSLVQLKFDPEDLGDTLRDFIVQPHFGAGMAVLDTILIDNIEIVMDNDVDSVALNYSDSPLEVGKTLDLNALVYPLYAYNHTVTWASLNEAIATVNDTGLVEAVGAGTTKIVVTTKDGAKTDTCNITALFISTTGVSLNKDVDTIAIGGTTMLTETVSPANATNKNVAWKSMDEAVATVVNGEVTGVSIGTANIVATTEDGNFADTCMVTVNPIPVSSVLLDYHTLDMQVGNNATIVATVAPANASNKNVTWSSDNEAVATVINGEITAVSEGMANIVVTTQDGGLKDTCIVSVVLVVPVTGVTLNKEQAMIYKDSTLVLTATVAPVTASDKSVAWTSSNESVATVVDGTVTALGDGTAKIAVTTTDGAKTDTCYVTVETYYMVTGITVSLQENEVNIGGNFTLTATVAPANATMPAFTWSSDNQAVATIDANGNVTVLSIGTANIIAGTTEGSFKDTCVLSVVPINVTSVTVSANSIQMFSGVDSTITATVMPANATNKNVAWSSDNESVATVTNGIVTAVASGTANIIVATEDGGLKDTCVVNVMLKTFDPIIANWDDVVPTKVPGPGVWQMFGWQTNNDANRKVANPSKSQLNSSDSCNTVYYTVGPWDLSGLFYEDGIEITGKTVGVELLTYATSALPVKFTVQDLESFSKEVLINTTAGEWNKLQILFEEGDKGEKF